MVPAATVDAFDRLVADGRFDVRSGLVEEGAFGDASFVVRFCLPPSNVAGLPPEVDVRVLVPGQFPFAKVEFTPRGSDVRGFPHQGHSGALCLKSSASYPPKPAARLRAYVESAQEWLEDAANDTLLAAGQPWELPDFRNDRKDLPPRIYLLETEASFAQWRDRVGRFGTVQFAGYIHGRGLVPIRFADASGRVLQPEVSEGFLNRKVTVMGAWILLPSHLAWRHRPACAFEELETQCREVGIDLWAPLKQALKATPSNGFHFILVGAAIARTVGHDPSEVHWQAIAFPVHSTGPFAPGTRPKTRTGSEENTFRARMRGAMLRQAIPWGSVTNAAPTRLTTRGALAEGARAKRVRLIGCGALGSLFAEHLARGGVRDLALFDGETLDLENLPRHSLAGPEVGRSKAIELARRLTGIHPLAHVRGYYTSLPIHERPPKVDREARVVLDDADVYLDCTADDIAFRWVSKHGRDSGKPVLHAFLNAHARMLTICASGRHVSCVDVSKKLFDDIHDGRVPFNWDEYCPAEEEIVPGAGCWQATFPAKGSDIAALVAGAVPIVEHLLTREYPSRGTGIVLRRRELVTKPNGELDLCAGMGLVEVAWSAPYR